MFRLFDLKTIFGGVVLNGSYWCSWLLKKHGFYFSNNRFVGGWLQRMTEFSFGFALGLLLLGSSKGSLGY